MSKLRFNNRKLNSTKGNGNGQNTKIESSEQAIRLPIGAGQNYQDSWTDNHQRQRGEEHLGRQVSKSRSDQEEKENKEEVDDRGSNKRLFHPVVQHHGLRSR